MKILFLAVLTFSVFTGWAQSNVFNEPNARVRELKGPFHAVHVKDGIELHVVQGKEVQLAVSMKEEQDDEKLITEVVDGVLKVYYKRDALKMGLAPKSRAKVWVSLREIDAIEANAGASVHIAESLQAKSLQIKLNSGASIEGSIQVATCTIDQHSGAVSRLKGTVEQLQIESHSGASCKSQDLVVQKADARVSSGGGVRITVQKELTAMAGSGGYIQYQGDGVIKEIKVNSGGSVKKI